MLVVITAEQIFVTRCPRLIFFYVRGYNTSRDKQKGRTTLREKYESNR